MPGANCSIFGCSTSRKTTGISIHRIPTGDDEYSKNWREQLVNIITKDRVIDQSLKSQIDRKLLYVCELHFPENCSIRHETKTNLVPKSIPTLNLPVKSFSKDPTIQKRSITSIEKREAAVVQYGNAKSFLNPSDCYKSFTDFLQRIEKLKLQGWEIKRINNIIISITKYDTEHVLSKIEMQVDQHLHYKILCFNWILPESNELFTKYNSSFKNVTLSTLIHEIDNNKICQGVPYKSEHILTHHVPKLHNPDCSDPILYTVFNRPKDCILLCEKEKCRVCFLKNQQHFQYLKRKETTLQQPIKPNAPITFISSERLKVSMQYYRLENKELKNQVTKLQKELNKCAIHTSDSLNKDLVSIMSSADPSKVSPFMKFFWGEQQKYYQASSTGVRYHPAIIRYCLSF